MFYVYSSICSLQFMLELVVSKQLERKRLQNINVKDICIPIYCMVSCIGKNKWPWKCNWIFNWSWFDNGYTEVQILRNLIVVNPRIPQGGIDPSGFTSHDSQLIVGALHERDENITKDTQGWKHRGEKSKGGRRRWNPGAKLRSWLGTKPRLLKGIFTGKPVLHSCKAATAWYNGDPALPTACRELTVTGRGAMLDWNKVSNSTI